MATARMFNVICKAEEFIKKSDYEENYIINDFAVASEDSRYLR